MADFELINANDLDTMEDPTDGYSFVMIDRTTNKGWLIDYNTLADLILSKVYDGRDTIADDGIKIYTIN